MGTVTVFTAVRMKQIEDTTVVSGHVDTSGDLILQTRAGDPINAGNVKGPKGDDGTNGTNGANGTNGTNGRDALNGRNKIINGDFRINQRCYVSGAAVADWGFGFDRWHHRPGAKLSFTAAPQGQMVTLLTNSGIYQNIERDMIVPGRYVLSWKGTAKALVVNSGDPLPPMAASPIIVDLDGTKTVTVLFEEVAGKTIGDVQLEPGEVPTPFERLPFGQELLLCQRYYEKTFNYAVAPGTVDQAGQWQSSQTSSSPSATYAGGSFQYKVPKRVTPTVTPYSGFSATPGTVYRHTLGGAGAETSLIAFANIGENGFYIYAYNGNGAAGLAAHFVMEAEL